MLSFKPYTVISITELFVTAIEIVSGDTVVILTLTLGLHVNSITIYIFEIKERNNREAELT